MAALFGVIWFQERSQRHFLFWGLGFLAHALGVILILARDAIPDLVSIGIANAVTLSSFFFWITALRHCDRREPIGWAALPSLLWIAAMLVPDIRDLLWLRAATYAFAAMTGYLLLAGTALSGRFSGKTYRRILAAIWTVQAANCTAFGILSILRAPQSFEQLSHGTVYGMISMACFVSTLVVGAKIMQDQSEQRLRQLLGKDPLTGVLNRRGMSEAMAGLRARVASDETVALLVFDLDHFKAINDTYGHQAGDAVLVHYAGTCAGAFARKGIFGRSGGEEFNAILGVASLKEAARIGETIRRRIADTPIETDSGTVSLTVSIGIATMPPDLFDLDELTKRADRALYAAKAAGRNRTAVMSDDRVLVVPTGSKQERDEQIDSQADRHVAVLRRVSAVAAANANRSAL